MTHIEHAELTSPLTLLEQWRDRTDGAALRELLVTGYTVDLAFLERFCVHTARALGARITVLGDSVQSIHDPVDVRFAGRAYQHGLAVVRGAFHPKVAILLGDDEVWAAIGSGNPTMSGWGHNHELWWVMRGALARGPRAQAQLGEWLAALPERVPMPSWIDATLRQIGHRIVPEEVDGSHAGVAVLGNLDAPLLEQLPTGPVRELHLAAPFFDVSGRVVRAVLDRLPAPRVDIGLQQDLTSFDGRTLVHAVRDATDVRFCDVAADRTMHGKLIEWTALDGRPHAVVGSANITAPALLRTVDDGGNCELVVLSPVNRRLFPAGNPIPASEVASHVYRDDSAADLHPVLHLLGCRIADGRLQVEFVARHAVAVTLETSVDGSPGSWTAVAAVPKERINSTGMTTSVADAPEITGGVVRLVAEINGEFVESAPVFVTDTVRCRPRTDVGDAPRLRHDYDIDQIIVDQTLAGRFSADLLRLLELSREQRAVAPASSVSREANARVPEDRWQRFLDVVTHSLGPSITQLVFPGALVTSGTAEAEGWSVGEVGDETELTEGEDENAVEDLDGPATRQAIVVPSSARSRYRSWARRWVKAVSAQRPARGQAVVARPALPLRMTVGSLYVELLAAGLWGSDETWREELAALVQALVSDPTERADTPEEGRDYLGSLVAVCLALLLQGAELHGGAPNDVVARRAWDNAHELAALAKKQVVEALLATSSQAHARVASVSEVLDVAELAREALTDPHAEARAGFEADGYEVERPDGYWVIRGEFRNTMRIAARAVTELAVPEGVAVLATNGRRSTLMLRRGSMLVMADTSIRQWRTYQILPPTTPASKFAGGDGVPTTRTASPLPKVPDAVRALAGDLGIDIGSLLGALAPRRSAVTQ